METDHFDSCGVSNDDTVLKGHPSHNLKVTHLSHNEK